MARIAILLTLLMIGGCSSSPNIKLGNFSSHIDLDDWSMNTDEKLYMAVHIVDVLQTLNHGKDPCYKENDYITKHLIGEQPSTTQIIGWGIAKGIVNHYGYQLIDNSNLPKWLKRTLKWTNTALHVNVINNNYQIGINLYGDNDHYKAPKKTRDCAKRYNL